jgi:hypothetical protein
MWLKTKDLESRRKEEATPKLLVYLRTGPDGTSLGHVTIVTGRFQLIQDYGVEHPQVNN